MARTFKVYNGSTKIAEGASPIKLTGLTANTLYKLQVSAVEDGQESEKVAIPDFTTKAATVAVTGVTLTPATASVEVGKTTPLTAKVAPDNATNKAVTYKSSDEAKATVDAKGVVTGVAAGTADITVTTTDGSKTAKSTITVTAAAGA